MRGRKPKPTVLKLISGSAKPINVDEPQPLGDLSDPPEELSDAEKVVWRRVISRSPVGLLRQLDGDAVQMYCQLWVERDEHRAKIKQFGAVVKSPNDGMPIQSPYVSMEKKCTAMLRGLMSDFGFNPTSRTRISTGGQGPGKTNRFSNNAKKKPD